MASLAKKRKHEKQRRNYNYQANWEQDYFVVKVGENCACLVCDILFRMNKKTNVQRHFQTFHEALDVEFPKGSKERTTRIEQFKMKRVKKTVDFSQVVESDVASTTRLSFRIAFILAKSMRPFDDGSLIKEMMIEMADELIENEEVRINLLEKIKDTQLSRETLARRVKSISANLQDQLTEQLHNSECFSLQVDETSDYVETPTFVALARLVMADCTSVEEMLCIIQLNGRPSANDLFEALTEDLTAKKLPLSKLVSITTNGAPAVVQRQVELVKMCKEDARFPSTMLNHHSVGRLLASCAKSVDTSHVMQPIIKIVGSVKTARSPQQKLFRSLLHEVGTDCNDLSTHLSGSKVLQRFHVSLRQIQEFCKFRNEEFPELRDQDWLMDLAFFADLMKTFDELNQKIRQRDIPVWTSISHIVDYRRQIKLWIEFFEENEISDAFKQLTKTLKESETTNDFCGKRFAKHLINLANEFEEKFKEFEPVEKVREYFCDPMRQEETRAIAATMTELFPTTNTLKLREEMVSLRHNENCRFMLAKSVTTDEFWKMVDQKQFVNLTKIYKQLLSCFGSSGLCDTIFNSMRQVKCGFRSRINGENVEEIVRISASTYKPDFQKIVDKIKSEPIDLTLTE